MSDHASTRILIVEDDFLVAEMIQGILEECGYTILGMATDGREAIQMTLRLRPDVVFMDIHLPVMNGLEASREILRICPTPIVVLTAYEHRELVEEARKAGVTAFLVKPPSPAGLEQAIATAKAQFRKTAEAHAPLPPKGDQQA